MLRSRTVEGKPPFVVAFLYMKSSLLPKDNSTCALDIAGASPDKFALVPVIGLPSSLTTDLINSEFGIRIPIVSIPGDKFGASVAAFLSIIVNSPGQYFSKINSKRFG